MQCEVIDDSELYAENPNYISTDLSKEAAVTPVCKYSDVKKEEKVEQNQAVGQGAVRRTPLMERKTSHSHSAHKARKRLTRSTSSSPAHMRKV